MHGRCQLTCAASSKRQLRCLERRPAVVTGGQQRYDDGAMSFRDRRRLRSSFCTALTVILPAATTTACAFGPAPQMTAVVERLTRLEEAVRHSQDTLRRLGDENEQLKSEIQRLEERERTRDEVLARILPSAVQIVLEQREGRRLRTGSGVAIGARAAGDHVECFVLTSGHVLAGLGGKAQAYVLIERERGVSTKLAAEVLDYEEPPGIDLALLRIRTDRCVSALTGSAASLGEPVWVVAFPWGREMTLASGIVSQATFGETDPDAGSQLMVDALVSYGTSGGGVFASRSGLLIGVVEGYRTARLTAGGGEAAWYVDVPVPGQTLVTPVADIRRFLERTGYPDLAPAAGSPP